MDHATTRQPFDEIVRNVARSAIAEQCLRTALALSRLDATNAISGRVGDIVGAYRRAQTAPQVSLAYTSSSDKTSSTRVVLPEWGYDSSNLSRAESSYFSVSRLTGFQSSPGGCALKLSARSRNLAEGGSLSAKRAKHVAAFEKSAARQCSSPAA